MKKRLRDRRKRRVEWPLVTVAMVVRNAESTFQKTFRSVISQTYPNLEIVVVDGNSTDDTLKIIKKNKSRIDAWISEPDAGTYDGMHKAARMATGRWILFMNAGDFFYTKDALKRAMKKAPKNADFVFGHHIYQDTDGRKLFQKANDFRDLWKRLRSGNLGADWISSWPCHQATFTRTSLLKSGKGYDFRNFPMGADQEFLYRMYKKRRKFHNCNEMLAVYTGGGMSAQNETQSIRDWWAIARKYGPPHIIDDYFYERFSAKLGMGFWQKLLLRCNVIHFPILNNR